MQNMFFNFQILQKKSSLSIFNLILRLFISLTCTPPNPKGPRKFLHSAAISGHFHSKRCTIPSWSRIKCGSFWATTADSIVKAPTSTRIMHNDVANYQSPRYITVSARPKVNIGLCIHTCCFHSYDLHCIASLVALIKHVYVTNL